jgi:hypothetical protein
VGETDHLVLLIAQFPIENHSDQGQFAALSLKAVGKCKIWAIIVQFEVPMNRLPMSRGKSAAEPGCSKLDSVVRNLM